MNTIVAARLKDRVLFGYDSKKSKEAGIGYEERVKEIITPTFIGALAVDGSSEILEQVVQGIEVDDPNMWQVRVYLKSNFPNVGVLFGAQSLNPGIEDDINKPLPILIDSSQDYNPVRSSFVGSIQNVGRTVAFLATDYSQIDRSSLITRGTPIDDFLPTVQDVVVKDMLDIIQYAERPVIHSLTQSGLRKEFMASSPVNMPYEAPKEEVVAYQHKE